MSVLSKKSEGVVMVERGRMFRIDILIASLIISIRKKVKKMVPAVKKYADKLIAEGVVTKEEFEDEARRYDQILEESLEAGKEIDRYSLRPIYAQSTTNLSQASSLEGK